MKEKEGREDKEKILEGISGANKLVRKPREWSQSEVMVSWTFKVAEAAVEGIILNHFKVNIYRPCCWGSWEGDQEW